MVSTRYSDYPEKEKGRDTRLGPNPCLRPTHSQGKETLLSDARRNQPGQRVTPIDPITIIATTKPPSTHA